MKSYIILSLLALFVACSSNKSEIQGKKNQQICLDLTDDVQLSDSLEFAFIPLETNEQCLIGVVGQVEIRDERIYVLDSYKSMALFVFDMEGKFLTQIGKRGVGPGEYITPRSFDFDSSTNTIIVNDIEKKELLYFDLYDYQFKYAKALPDYFQTFSTLSNHSVSFFSSSGIRKERGEDYYVLICDSLLNPVRECIPANFKSGYSYTLGGRNFYRVGDRDFVYHEQIPVIYEIIENEIKIYHELVLGTFDFPPITYLQEESANNTYFVPNLLHSGYISGYMVCETEDLLCVMFTKGITFYYGFYHKNSTKGYLYTANAFAQKGGIRIPVYLKGATDQYIIGVLQPSFIGKPSTPNKDLQPILDRLSPEDNPVLCLFKWKK